MKKQIGVALALLVGGFLVTRIHRSDAPADKLVFDRVWIDHLPTSDTDRMQVFVVLDEPEIGLFEFASQWKREMEIFKVAEHGGSEVTIFYPQTRQREKVSVSAEPCKKGDFDYCLTLRGASHGVSEYVSKKGWEIDAHADLRSLKLPQM